MTTTTLGRAKRGDQDAFSELVDPYRRQLHVHCYRILGSFQDAEDVLQEVLLSAWRALEDFDGRSLRAWLYRIATNRCLNYLRDGSRRPRADNFPVQGAVSTDEPWWLEPYPDVLFDDAALGPEARYEVRESIALSFVAGLQKLPPQQRAALVLRDVLGFSASEAADILGSTTASVNSALQRARAGFRFHRDREKMSVPRSADEMEVVRLFVDAFESGDLQRIIGLLTNDARLTMPPDPIGYQGPQAIVEFLRLRGIWDHGIRLVATRANHQPAFGYYLPDPQAPIWRANGLIVLTAQRRQVSGLTRFGDTGLLARFGLPRTLPDA